jgi:hypothetical protein
MLNDANTNDFLGRESAEKQIDVVIHDDIGRHLKVTAGEPIEAILHKAIGLFGFGQGSG